MKGIIDGVDFVTIEAERYWNFPSGYKGDPKTEIKNMILSNTYLGAIKKDGAYERFVKDEDGNMMLISRTESVTGEPIDKIGHVPHLHTFFDQLPNGTCLLGELYFPNRPGSRHVTTIMGCLEEKAIQRQENEKLYYYIFDIWAWEGKSFLSMRAEDRFEEIKLGWRAYPGTYVEWARYEKGMELLSLLYQARAEGEEGIVITRAASMPEPGKRTSRKTLKIKKEIENDIDCFLTGRFKEATRDYTGDYIENWSYWRNIKTNEKVQGSYFEEYANGGPYEPITKKYFNGWPAAVEIAVVDEEKKLHVLGWVGNLTDEIKAQIATNPSNFKLKVVQISAMDFDPESERFRHSKIIQWREDKKWTECQYSQVK
jgi:hypothetical protein